MASMICLMAFTNLKCNMRNRQEDVTGVPSGFTTLDRITYGWQKSDLIILAARPSVGKTAFALNLARNAALHPSKPTPVAFFSLEMSAGQLVQRILSAESEIWLEKIARGKMEDHAKPQNISHNPARHLHWGWICSSRYFHQSASAYEETATSMILFFLPLHQRHHY